MAGVPNRADAAVITNYLFDVDRGYLPQYSMAVNVGDTIVWFNPPGFIATNYVQGYGGEWKSPVLHPGDSFSYTFSKPGFYPYRTGIPLGAVNAAGTVTVGAWTGAPPAVTFNTPVDGAFVAPVGVLMQVSTTNAENLAAIQYFANSKLIGTATNSPYALDWEPGVLATFSLVAPAIDRQGAITASLPIKVTTTPRLYLGGTTMLPTGELLFNYSFVPSSGAVYRLIYTDGFPATNPGFLGTPVNSGVIVDESVRGRAIPARFYGFRFLTGKEQ
jgi:hypothetical protein